MRTMGRLSFSMQVLGIAFAGLAPILAACSGGTASSTGETTTTGGAGGSGGAGSTMSSTTSSTISTSSSTGGAGGTDSTTSTGTGGNGTCTPTLTSEGQFVITWYSFQDNTPVNSAQSASGRDLVPYLSVAVPFHLLVPFGGKFNYGDKLYLEFLKDRTMPNGMKHTGWVQIDDFCGDDSDDSYCYQTVGGNSYPNTDLYIGDFTKSGMTASSGNCSGPAGSGQELTNVFSGDAGCQWVDDYGGAALGTGKCGDYGSAESQQGGTNGGCWDYTPPSNTVQYCQDCTSSTCSSW